MKKNGIVTKKKSTRRAPVRKNSLQKLVALPYKIELLPLSKEDGSGFLAMVPLLKGCQSDGNTPDEAIHNLREAQKAWFASALKNDDPIPLPGKI
jgi:predicted RNase H-like HicB family nuclease